METVLTRASESIVFGLKSTKKSTKVVKKRWRICSGRRSRKFESCHLDHKESTALVAVLSLCLCVAVRIAQPQAAQGKFACKLERKSAGLGATNRRSAPSCHLDQKSPWKPRFARAFRSPCYAVFRGGAICDTNLCRP